jgi:serine protease Do
MLSNRKSTLFYLLLVIVASVVVGMVLASRLDLSSSSTAQTLAAPPMNSAPITGPLTATTFRDVAKSVSPAVVNIRTESKQRAQDLSDLFGGGGGGGGGDDLLDRFFGLPGAPQGRGGGRGQGQGQRPEPREETVRAAGTGFIIDKSGLILTNNHVIEGATKIEVSLYGEDEDQLYEARVVGRDPLTDSALIELTEKPNHELPTVKFGDSSQMQPGDWVMAIGNPFGLAHTVSVGVISANRPNELDVAPQRQADVLQTDAAINPGNSGGPLLNLRGEVIGINTAIATTGLSQGNMGVGFAIPSNSVRELLPQLRSGKITRGRIGVGVGIIDRDALDELGLKERTGALVTTVTDDAAADKAGIEIGDVILAFNGQPVKNSSDLVRMVTATKPGTTVPVRILRDKQERTLNLTVDELDLEAESGARPDGRGGRAPEPAPTTTTGFGMTIDNLSPEVARRLRLDDGVRGAVITDVEQESAAARYGLRPGDVIVRVGSVRITTAAEAQRELARVPAGGTALMRVIRMINNTPTELFLTPKKD